MQDLNRALEDITAIRNQVARGPSSAATGR